MRLLKGESRCRSAAGGRAAAAAARAGAETKYTLLLSVNIARSQFVTSPGLRQTPEASAAAQDSSGGWHTARTEAGLRLLSLLTITLLRHVTVLDLRRTGSTPGLAGMLGDASDCSQQ